MKIESKSASWVLESTEVNYLYSYFLKFGCKKEIIIFNKKNKIHGALLNDLKILFEEALRDLIENCYIEPSLRSRQKHPTRFQKFEFENKKYVVNYVLSPIGRLIFLLFSRIQMIKNAIDNDDWIILDMTS